MTNMTSTTRAVPITDHKGTVLTASATREPPPGSVALTQGEWGTAWQRFFSDGLWYPVTGGRPHSWVWLLSQRNLVLVYDAEVRPGEQR